MKLCFRDLKLDNTLLEDSPSGPAYVRICDFGFAKAWTAATDNMKTAIGTPVYMSPQVRGCSAQCVRLYKHCGSADVSCRVVRVRGSLGVLAQLWGATSDNMKTAIGTPVCVSPQVC
jgi:serine/threonine protein kinase